MKKSLMTATILSLLLAMLSIDSSRAGQAAFPDPGREILCVVGWPPDSPVDRLARALLDALAPEVRASIRVENRAGMCGALAMTGVANMPADGYTILIGAENPIMYKVLGLSEYDYDDFTPIGLSYAYPSVLYVASHLPYRTIEELVRDALERPGTLRLVSLGPANTTVATDALLRSTFGVHLRRVNFEDAREAMLGAAAGYVDLLLLDPFELYELGDFDPAQLRPLVVMGDERLSRLPDIPAITEIYPEMRDIHIPSPAFGLFVRRDTPSDVQSALQDIFFSAMKTADFRERFSVINPNLPPLTGEAADARLERDRANVVWLLHDADMTKISPHVYGITRPER